MSDDDLVTIISSASFELFVDDGARPEDLEAAAGRLLLESSKLREARGGPDDEHEINHILACLVAGDTDGEDPQLCVLNRQSLLSQVAIHQTRAGAMEAIEVQDLDHRGPRGADLINVDVFRQTKVWVDGKHEVWSLRDLTDRHLDSVLGWVRDHNHLLTKRLKSDVTQSFLVRALKREQQRRQVDLSRRTRHEELRRRTIPAIETVMPVAMGSLLVPADPNTALMLSYVATGGAPDRAPQWARDIALVLESQGYEVIKKVT